jgi:sugar lactone lactonase YvrE
VRIRGIIVAALAAALFVPAASAAADDHVETFATFDPAAAEFPEGIAIDKTGNVYVSMIELDQIWKIDRSGSRSIVSEFAAGSGPAGLAVDPTGTVYVAVSAFDPATGQPPALKGVYRVARDGTNEHLPGTEVIAFPNDVTLDEQGNVYATDTAGGAVWRISKDGSVAIWKDDPLLAGDGSFGFGFPIGANGIAVRQNKIIVANTERGLLVEVPVRPDGSAGIPTVLAESPLLVGVDGIALDVHGDVYAGIGVQNLVIRVSGDGSVRTLATGEDGLNQPSTLAFGTVAGDQQALFVANFSLFSPQPTPGVLKLRVGVPAMPLP